MNANAASKTIGNATGIHAARSPGAVWTGRVLTGLAALFLAVDAVMKVFSMRPAVEGTVRLGYPAGTVVVIGVLLSLCLAVFLVPRTSLAGAVLLTGYLGGAVATHVRFGSPLFSETLFPVYVAAFLWAGLWLRDRRVAALFASTSTSS